MMYFNLKDIAKEDAQKKLLRQLKFKEARDPNETRVVRPSLVHMNAGKFYPLKPGKGYSYYKFFLDFMANKIEITLTLYNILLHMQYVDAEKYILVMEDKIIKTLPPNVEHRRAMLSYALSMYTEAKLKGGHK